jgi:hypothetical protein
VFGVGLFAGLRHSRIDYKLFNTFLGATHFPPGAIGALLVLVLVVNPLLRMVSKKLAFSRNEALTVYITCLFSSLIPGHGAENFLIPNLLSSFYFATRENKWLEFLEPYVKPWMTPALTADGTFDRTIVEPWYVGLSEGQHIPWPGHGMCWPSLRPTYHGSTIVRSNVPSAVSAGVIHGLTYGSRNSSHLFSRVAK